MLLEKLIKNETLRKGEYPDFIISGSRYLIIHGSQLYGCSNDNSDMDVYGFCINPKEQIFPHLQGEIPGFGTPIVPFNQYQKHGLSYMESNNKYEVDLNIYGIVQFFNLCLGCSPNMVECLFAPYDCILQCADTAKVVLNKRKLFLNKKFYHTARGYAQAQLHATRNKKNPTSPKRIGYIEQYGYDVKLAYNIFRLMLEAEQVLLEGDLDLRTNKELYKAVRRGEYTLDQVTEWHAKKESDLEKLYHSSGIPNKPNEHEIRTLLYQVLEMEFGNLDNVVKQIGKEEVVINQIKKLLVDNGY